ncbi:MAG: PepSY domain-containing protein [Proteobacteria bacterium]|nr:PepSY domain-containing protein [Pseudomonadota bacterium]
MKLKPILFSVHRWLGIGMCLLFTLWFASGIVMMYVEYPQLTEAERLGKLPDLNPSQVLLSPFAAAASIHPEQVFSAVKLSTVLDRPAYQFQVIDGSNQTVFADTGEVFTGLDRESAIAAAAASGFSHRDSVPAYDALITMDQWSIAAGLNRFRPLHRVKMNDPAGTVVYVSDNSGQIVLDTHRNERFWNWLGSTIHWIYPLQLRQNGPLWTKVIIYVSLIGIVSVVTGGIVGFMRIRLGVSSRGTGISPYTGMMKWHHILGLVSLVFVFTFIFSGLMSMGPWGIFNPATSAQAQINRYTGGNVLRLSNLPLPDFRTVDGTVKEVVWHKISSAAYYSLIKTQDDRVVGFGDGSSGNQSLRLLAMIEEAVPRLLPDATLLSLELVRQQDNYYYSRRHRYRPLPIYRAKFDDIESTWYHIDPLNGELVNRVTDASRWERWLFNGLHSLDFQFLLQRRPLWDIVVISLSLLGFVFSISAVVIGWRRLRN